MVKARHQAHGQEAVTQSITPSDLAQLVSEQVDIARNQVNYHFTRAQVGATSHVPDVKTELRPVILGLVARTETLLYGIRPVQPYVELSGSQVSFLIFMGQAQRLTGLQIHEIDSPGN